MWYLIVSVIAATGLILGFFGCFSGSHVKSEISTDQQNDPRDSIRRQLTREELREKMVKLAVKKVPDNLSQGAMCYKVAGPQSRAEYVCPVCGKKTLYTDDNGWFINGNLSECRRIAASLVEINCKLDESQFCKHCTPDLETEPQLCITTQYKGEEKINKVCSIDRHDMIILDEFLSGKAVHSSDQDYETPLKDELDRISRLLGIELAGTAVIITNGRKKSTFPPGPFISACHRSS
jgi:hypothetical protein